METFLLLVLIVVLVLRWAWIRSRFDEIEERISVIESASVASDQIAALARRVHQLESTVRTAAMPVVAPQTQPPPPPPSSPAPPIREPEPTRPVELEVEPPGFATAQPDPPFYEPAAPTWTERLRSALGNEEWEALLGGSLLNKLGAVVLVIGIALFVAYSFGRITPPGRAAIALVISASILAAGVRVERRARYQVFARGLIGAGWAALYPTAYAIYALPAARIIGSPFAGSIGLFAVAAGMIAHSLRYRSQVVTSIAYFAAFASLAATPSTPFAVLSLIPLALSLLCIVLSLNWHGMASFGLIATWITCISRSNSGAPLASTQALFLTYWLLFECFDLIRMRKRATGGGLEWNAPLNGLAFLALSYGAWTQHAPERLWFAAACAAGLYLANALSRAIISPPSRLEDGISFATRLRAGSYEPYLLAAAVLAGLSIVGRVPGVWTSVWLAVEAEILYLAGAKLRLPFLRRIGRSAFVASLARLIADGSAAGQTEVLGRLTSNWMAPALFHALVLYLNRAIERSGMFFSTAAATLLAAVLFAETPERYIGVAWYVLAAVLFDVGIRKRQLDFRVHAYALAAAASILTLAAHIDIPASTSSLPLAVAVFAVYTYAVRPQFDSQSALLDTERRAVVLAGSAATAICSSMLLWRTIPEAYVGLAWCGLAVVLFEAGNRGIPARMRLMSCPVAALAMAGILVTHAPDLVKFAALPVWLSYLGTAAAAGTIAARSLLWRPANMDEDEQSITAAVASASGTLSFLVFLWIVLPNVLVSTSWMLVALAAVELARVASARTFSAPANAIIAIVLCRLFSVDLRQEPDRVLTVLPVVAALYWLVYRNCTSTAGRVCCWAASVTSAFLIALECPDRWVPIGWIGFALVLFSVGLRARMTDLRLQAYAAGAASVTAALLLLIFPLDITACVFVIAGLYAFQCLAALRASTGIGARVAPASSVSATALLALLLYSAVSGGFLTVSWGLQGLALLAAGFVLRQRVLRLQALALLLVCILKLFIYDLRNLETMYRILSFIVLGIIMLGVSWIYTRFREHIRRYL